MNQSKASRITSEPNFGFIPNRPSQSAFIASCTRLRHGSTAAEQRRRTGSKHHSGRKSGNPSNLIEPPTSTDSSRTWQSRSLTGGRASGKPEEIFANHRSRRPPQSHPRVRTVLTTGHARRPGADTEASRDLDAGKKLSRNPRLSDQHQAVSHRPQNGIRSFQVSSRSPALTRACKPHRRSCKRANTSHHSLQHQLLLGALLFSSLSLFGQHAQASARRNAGASGKRFARSLPLRSSVNAIAQETAVSADLAARASLANRLPGKSRCAPASSAKIRVSSHSQQHRHSAASARWTSRARITQHRGNHHHHI